MRLVPGRAALALALIAALAAVPAFAQEGHGDKEKDKKADPPRGDHPEDRGAPKEQAPPPNQGQQKQEERAQQQHAQEQQQRAQQQEQRAVEHAQEQERARVERQQRQAAPPQSQPAPVAPAPRAAAAAPPPRAQEQRAVVPPPPAAAIKPPRLSEERQQRLIEQQRVRTAHYDQRLQQQMAAAEQLSRALEQQRRTAQYRFQQDYLAHLRQQQVGLAALRAYDYGRDPYFYSAPVYRYSRGGQYYDINQYGADALQQAVSDGYQEGFRAGQADREDHWRYDYRDSYAYQDALYGYRGLYVDAADYEYYFREGFQRGYDDGYYGRYRYGTAANGGLNIIASVLSQILGLQALR